MAELSLQTKRPELLAPVQDFTNLACAIDSGCDAVYFGLKQLNMRNAARNFEAGDVPALAARCAAAGVKCYLTLNVTLFDNECATAADILDQAADHIDAVVCCDPCIMKLCRDRGIPFHVSTQASVSNSVAAEFYRDMGASRIIPARECTLEEVHAIRRNVAIEIETFVHGAMCVSYSGRCFLSQFSSGKSGNRGECLQNCRRVYRIIDETDPLQEYELGADYVLSARDLCTIPFIDQLLGVGIDAFKIEGRNRNPQYVSVSVACYREAIDAYFDGRMDQDLKNRLVARLRKVYNREFSSGFYQGRPIAEFTRVNGSMAEEQKRFVGVVDNYYAKVRVAELRVQDHTFGIGDVIAIEGPTTGLMQFRVEKLRQDEVTVDEVKRGTVTVLAPGRVRRNDRVFRIDRRTTFNNGR